MSSKLLHVYSNITIDITREGVSIGGPGYYSFKTIHILNLPLRVEVFSCVPRHGPPHPLDKSIINCSLGEQLTIFEIREDSEINTRRALWLRSFCGRCYEVSSGDLALISPVYWELPSHNILKIVRNYSVVGLDVQGFLRLGTKPIENKPILLDSILYDVPRDKVIIKASIEDVGPLKAFLMLARGDLDIVTLGYYGSIVRIGERLYYISVDKVARRSIGAGDIFMTILLYYLYEGLGVLEASTIASFLSYYVLEEINPPKVEMDINKLVKRLAQRISISEALNLLYSSI